ncbi:MAG: SDR family NAD(P)-dependent oxidoreductase [Micrococcales bacterium]
MTKFHDKTVLVVGGSGVLGGNLVTGLLAQGARVLATATSNESATRIPATGQPSLLLNLSEPASIKAAADWLNQNFEQLDGVVLASGRVGFGTAESTSTAQRAELMQVNFLGQADLLNQVMPLLRASGQNGREPFIAAITGVVAEKPFPGMSAYCASKTAFSSYLAVLKTELRREKIQVLDARPGHTETGLATRPLFGVAPAMPAGMDPQHVTSAILSAIDAGESVLPSASFTE